MFGYKKVAFSVDSRWLNKSAEILTFDLDELLATKMRALYQRKKGRDLFDLANALSSSATDPGRIIEAFETYTKSESIRITRAQFEQNLAAKLRDPQFNSDIGPLLTQGHKWDVKEAAQSVSDRLIAILLGEPWSGEL